MSLDQILREKPNLDELYEHTRVGTKWYKFGVLLKLDVRDLDAIEELNKDIDFKALKMFQLWLNSDPEATRKQVVNILRKDVIGEMIVADKYENVLREQYSEYTNINSVIIHTHQSIHVFLAYMHSVPGGSIIVLGHVLVIFICLLASFYYIVVCDN